MDIVNFVNRVNNVVSLRRVMPRYDSFAAYNDCEFRERYRLTKDSAKFVIDLVKQDLQHQTINSQNISVEVMVLVTLRFFVKGCYQIETGDSHGLSQPSVSRIVRKVSEAIARHSRDFIVWPSHRDSVIIKEKFLTMGRFPGVVGVIDCTHIKIKNPKASEKILYCNRKGFCSLNVQVVCDTTCKIRNIVARFKGSDHDSRIFNESMLKQRCENGLAHGIILGDSDYVCKPYLLTPLHNPRSPAEQRYQSAHATTRVTIERCFGQWKSMFKALSNGLSISLDTARIAIVAMAIVYNIRLEKDGEDFSEYNEQPAVDDDLPVNLNHDDDNAFRRAFIERHF